MKLRIKVTEYENGREKCVIQKKQRIFWRDLDDLDLKKYSSMIHTQTLSAAEHAVKEIKKIHEGRRLDKKIKKIYYK